jgi:hypothetical protein
LAAILFEAGKALASPRKMILRERVAAEKERKSDQFFSISSLGKMKIQN